MTKFAKILIFTYLTIILSACGGGGSSTETTPTDANHTNTSNTTITGELVSASVIETIEPAIMLPIIQENIDANATNAFGYKAVKIIYTTTNMHGEKIEASGLLTLPTLTDAHKESLGVENYTISMVAENHWTIFTNEEAPTNVEIQNGTADYETAILFTSYGGFASIIPDYVGYGHSNSSNHPYILKDASANTSLDMIKASITYMQNNNLTLDNELYISGYSQGGFSALALAEEVEKNFEEVTLKAVAPMAGPYLVSEFADPILKSDALMTFPAFIAYVADAYSNAYEDITLEGTVVESKVTAFDGLFNGENDFLAILTKLGVPIIAPTSMLFDATFLSEYESDQNHKLRARFNENNLGNWSAKAKINLIHCSNDEVVPVSMAYGVEQVLMSHASHDIKTTILNNVTANIFNAETVHANCAVPAYKEAAKWFKTLKQNQ